MLLFCYPINCNIYVSIMNAFIKSYRIKASYPKRPSGRLRVPIFQQADWMKNSVIKVLFLFTSLFLIFFDKKRNLHT